MRTLIILKVLARETDDAKALISIIAAPVQFRLQHDGQVEVVILPGKATVEPECLAVDSEKPGHIPFAGQCRTSE